MMTRHTRKGIGPGINVANTPGMILHLEKVLRRDVAPALQCYGLLCTSQDAAFEHTANTNHKISRVFTPAVPCTVQIVKGRAGKLCRQLARSHECTTNTRARVHILHFHDRGIVRLTPARP